ncbi:MAG TPA: hypothetical protein VNO52_17270 [Methylomirabilota bacterium]|nr:hypothetical protein [Methylomirabilota bacterium]
MKRATLIPLVLVPLAVTSFEAPAQLFNDFEAATTGAEYSFRAPRFSGSTSGNLATTPNAMRVVEGFDANASKVGAFDFAFVDDATTRWVRLTTFNAAGLPNPVLDLNQMLQFDIFSLNDIRVAVGVREDADVAGPVGANGGASGSIEWVGAERASASAGTAPGGVLVTAGSWQTLTFNLKADPTFAFTGNGVLAGDWGTLESLAVSSMGTAAQTIYLDNFRMVPVPEPGTMALGLSAAVMSLIGLRRRVR